MIHFAPPACFISALALSVTLGSVAAIADPGGQCEQTTPGVVLVCQGEVTNPSAFTPNSDFTVDIGTNGPSGEAATIIQGSGFAGIKINAGNYGGVVDMTRNSSISVVAGSGSSRNGLVIASSASDNTKTFELNIDGTISSAAAKGDAVRLEGTDYSAFDVTFGRHAQIGGGTGDDAVMVTGAQSLLLKNYGQILGGTGQPTSGGEGINVGKGTRIAAGGVTIKNNGTITGTGVSGPNLNGQGIAVFAAGDVRIKNGHRGVITGATQGIYVEANDDVFITNDGHIQSDQKAGIEVADGDRVRIENTSANTIDGATDGVYLHDVDQASVDNDRGHIVGRDGDGVRIEDVKGDVSVENKYGNRDRHAEITGSDDGLHIHDVGDDVTVDNRYGGKIAGRHGDGIDIHDVHDDVAIDNRFGGEILGRDNGVQIDDVRDDVTIDNRYGGEISGHYGSGIDIDDVRGDVEIDNSRWGEIKGSDNGIKIRDVHDDVTIKNSHGGKIAGRHGDGIDIHDAHDDVAIDNRFGGEILGRDNGVQIDEVGDDVIIDNRFGSLIAGGHDGLHIRDVDGDITLQNGFGSAIVGGGDDGVDIEHVDGDVAISNSHGGIVYGRDDGIKIKDADGDVTIDNGSGLIGGEHGNGIAVEAEGAVEIGNRKDGIIGGNKSAIDVSAGSVEITSSGLLVGSGSDDATIEISSTWGATINNEAGGQIVGSDYSSSDRIVEAHGGAVTINNDGSMRGTIDISGAGFENGNVFNNTSDHSWTFTGVSQLGDGLNDAFNNTGTIYATNPDAPEDNDVTELAGVELFNNGSDSKVGTINLHDGYTGGVFILTPSEGGTLTYAGYPAQSILAVDTFLGTESNSSSDTFVINGNVTGKTGVVVSNLNTGFGGYNPNGIDVVRATGDLEADNFYLVGGPIESGFFTYDLYLNGENDWVLASAPNRTFFQLPSLTSAAQSVWHEASGIWLDRTADLRASVDQPCIDEGLKGSAQPCAAKAASGAWIRALGSSQSRDPSRSFALYDSSSTYNTGYTQAGGGVIGGYDIGRRLEDGRGTWFAGVMGGYLRSVVDFENSATSADFESGAVGGYVTYLDGGWFMDAKVMANIGRVDYKSAYGQKDNADVTSVGGVIDTGYRIAQGAQFIEPGATLAYVSTDIDDLSVFGTTANFATGESLRGRLGVRFGASFVNERAKYEPFLGVSAWYEFLGDNTASVANGGYGLVATDSMTGVIGEVSGGVNIYGLSGNGVSGFIKGNVEIGKDELVGYGGTFGLRVDW